MQPLLDATLTPIRSLNRNLQAYSSNMIRTGYDTRFYHAIQLTIDATAEHRHAKRHNYAYRYSTYLQQLHGLQAPQSWRKRTPSEANCDDYRCMGSKRSRCGEDTKGERACEELACLKSRKTEQNTNILKQHKDNPTTSDPRSLVFGFPSFCSEFLV